MSINLKGTVLRVGSHFTNQLQLAAAYQCTNTNIWEAGGWAIWGSGPGGGGGVCTQCAKTTSSASAPKSNRNALSILNIKSVLGSYTDVGGPRRAKFLCGHDDLQLKSLQALPGHGWGSSTVTRTDNLEDHRWGKKSSSGKCEQPQPCMQETGERRWGAACFLRASR